MIKKDIARSILQKENWIYVIRIMGKKGIIRKKKIEGREGWEISCFEKDVREIPIKSNLGTGSHFFDIVLRNAVILPTVF